MKAQQAMETLQPANVEKAAERTLFVKAGKLIEHKKKGVKNHDLQI